MMLSILQVAFVFYKLMQKFKLYFQIKPSRGQQTTHLKRPTLSIFRFVIKTNPLKHLQNLIITSFIER